MNTSKTIVGTLFLAGATLLATGRTPAMAQCEQLKLMRSGAEATDQLFGAAVSISGDYALIGVPLADFYCGLFYCENAGVAHVYKREGDTWVYQDTLYPTFPSWGDQFGYSVSISGVYAVVGAPLDDTVGANAGAAYIFKRDGTDWIQEAKFTDAGPGDMFGHSVSISGRFAVVGAPYCDATQVNGGAARLYRKPPFLLGWTRIHDYYNTTFGDDYHTGFSVGIATGGGYVWVIIGQPGCCGGNNMGRAVLVKHNAAGDVVNGGGLFLGSEIGARHGYSVAIAYSAALGDAQFVLGAPGEDLGSIAPDAGVVRIYTDHEQHPFFRLEATIFRPVTSDRSHDGLGFSVATNGNSVIAGLLGGDDAATDAGTANFYRPGDDGWESYQMTKLTAFDGQTSDLFGWSVAMTEDTAFVGAPGEDQGGSNAGAAYVQTIGDDSDGDDVFDACDNCVGVPNHGQEDHDDDGVGDVCDNCDNCHDNCADALLVTIGQTTFCNEQATTDGPQDCLGNDFSNDIWFRYVGWVTSTLTVDTCAGSTFDTVIEAYTGTCGSLVQGPCNDNDASCSPGSKIEVPVVAGQEILIRVGGVVSSGQSSGTGTLTLTLRCDGSDSDVDGDVDLDDYANFEACLLGPGGGLGVDCDCFDQDGDDDADLLDVAAFQVDFTGG